MHEAKLDLSVAYKTRSGDKATIIAHLPENSIGGRSVYPLKVAIEAQAPSSRKRYTVMTMDGKAAPMHRESINDIVGVWTE